VQYDLEKKEFNGNQPNYKMQTSPNPLISSKICRFLPIFEILPTHATETHSNSNSHLTRDGNGLG
jgi:hypothetical protein